MYKIFALVTNQIKSKFLGESVQNSWQFCGKGWLEKQKFRCLAKLGLQTIPITDEWNFRDFSLRFSQIF